MESENETELTAAAARPSEHKNRANSDNEDTPSTSRLLVAPDPQYGPPEQIGDDYLNFDLIFRHVERQAAIVKEALQDKWILQPSVSELTKAYEQNLFSPRVPPKVSAKGTCEPNPRVNFYPAFVVPEVLATYHVFFQNQRVPASCRANRTKADELLLLLEGACLPGIPTVTSVPKISTALGEAEVPASSALQKEDNEDSALVELEGDNPRLAIAKRVVAITHAAYPALGLPPKVMNTVLENLIQKIKQCKEPLNDEDDDTVLSVSDEEIGKWNNTEDREEIGRKRQAVLSTVFVTLQLTCMQAFFTDEAVLKKIEESLHYMFKHGYIKQACLTSGVDLTQLVTYMGILHENRLGHSTLHNTLKGEARRDYIRDCVYLFLVLTWQTAMGVWQQCLEPSNLQELSKILQNVKPKLYSADSEQTVAENLKAIVFPSKLLSTLQNGLPDIMNQSIVQNFRSFVLERSGLLPALANLFPSDFVPLNYEESPPTLWAHVYLFRLANYVMFHSDLAYDVTGPGLLQCYCRCNLCSPHRCLATNTNLLAETHLIDCFELQGPPGSSQTPLKLTPSLWTNAFLRKFVSEDYHPYEIQFYENQSGGRHSKLTACVITDPQIVSQLQSIKKAREEFMLKKGHGVYLDPQTGEELNGREPTTAANEVQRQGRAAILTAEEGAQDAEISSCQPPRNGDGGQSSTAASAEAVEDAAAVLRRHTTPGTPGGVSGGNILHGVHRGRRRRRAARGGRPCEGAASPEKA